MKEFLNHPLGPVALGVAIPLALVAIVALWEWIKERMMQ
jgi:hypothetical protein